VAGDLRRAVRRIIETEVVKSSGETRPLNVSRSVARADPHTPDVRVSHDEGIVLK
jgi:hypothetical protein